MKNLVSLNYKKYKEEMTLNEEEAERFDPIENTKPI